MQMNAAEDEFTVVSNFGWRLWGKHWTVNQAMGKASSLQHLRGIYEAEIMRQHPRGHIQRQALARFESQSHG